MVCYEANEAPIRTRLQCLVFGAKRGTEMPQCLVLETERGIQMKTINVGLLGIGTVGGGAWTVLRRNQEEIGRRAGSAITMKMVADKDIEKVRSIVGERAIV